MRRERIGMTEEGNPFDLCVTRDCHHGRHLKRDIEGRHMWIITQDGFYSVTAYDPLRGGERSDAEGLVIVRTRDRADLERVSDWIGDEVMATPAADYAFRIIASRSAWKNYWPTRPTRSTTSTSNTALQNGWARSVRMSS